MKYGRSKLILAKIISGWLYATGVYWGITLIYSSIYMIFLGTQGADLPIQLKYPAMSVGYNLTMGEAVGITLLLGYCFIEKHLCGYYCRISVDYNPNIFITGYGGICVEPCTIFTTT